MDYRGLRTQRPVLDLCLPVEHTAIGSLSPGELKKVFPKEQRFKTEHDGLEDKRDKSPFFLPGAWPSLRKDQVTSGLQPHCVPSPRQL